MRTSLFACFCFTMLSCASRVGPRSAREDQVGSERDASWYAARHGSCAAPLAPPTLSPAMLWLDVAGEHAAFRDRGLRTAPPNTLATVLESRREALRACLVPGERLELLVGHQSDGQGIEYRCGTTREQALTCVREQLKGLSVASPLIVSLHSGEATSGVPRGSLTKAEIRRTIESKLADVRSCYEDALVMRPSLRGRVSTRFVIDSAGNVHSSEVLDNQTGDDELACCVNHVLRTWTFPRPEGCGIVVVHYPFVLTT